MEAKPVSYVPGRLHGVIVRVMEGDAEVVRNAGKPGVMRMGLAKSSRAIPSIISQGSCAAGAGVHPDYLSSDRITNRSSEPVAQDRVSFSR